MLAPEKEELLRPSHRDRRHEQRPAAGDRLVHLARELIGGRLVRVAPISVRALEQQRVRRWRGRVRIDQQRRLVPAEVTGKDDPHYRSVDTGLRSFRGQHELALLFRRLGDLPHAEQVLREIVGGQPTYLPAQLDLLASLPGALEDVP